jgi:branched-chain amino acid transport system permease protein
MLEQQLVNALSLGCVYALFALGFTLVFGVLGVINLSHGAIFMIGAYAALEVVTKLNFPLWASLVAAFFIAGLFGLVIDFLVLKPLRKRNAPHLIPMIATIGLAIFFNSAAQGIFGAENQRFPSELVPDQQLHFWGVQISVLELAIVLDEGLDPEHHRSEALVRVLEIRIDRLSVFGTGVAQCRPVRHREVRVVDRLAGIERCGA